MNSKILAAFCAGAVLASGIVYLAVKEPVAPIRRVAAASKPIYVSADQAGTDPLKSPVVSAEAVPEESELPGDSPAGRKAKREVEKRSPMPPAASRPATTPAIASPAAIPSLAGMKIQTAEVRRPDIMPARPETPRKADPPEEQHGNANSGDAPGVAAKQETLPTPTPASPEPPREVTPASSVSEERPQPHVVTVTAGTVLPVRIGETLTASRNQPGDSFLATLDRPLVVDGFIIAERGARLEGRVVEADPGGRVRGASHLEVELVKLATADGQHVRIRTSAFQKQSQSEAGMDAAKVGIGAAIGAAIGGMAGGGKGAGIGAGVGGAAGAGDVLLTRGKAAAIPVETRVSFRLQEPVTITERLH